jgi:hypothetical protein
VSRKNVFLANYQRNNPLKSIKAVKTSILIQENSTQNILSKLIRANFIEIHPHNKSHSKMLNQSLIQQYSQSIFLKIKNLPHEIWITIYCLINWKEFFKNIKKEFIFWSNKGIFIATNGEYKKKNPSWMIHLIFIILTNFIRYLDLIIGNAVEPCGQVGSYCRRELHFLL